MSQFGAERLAAEDITRRAGEILRANFGKMQTLDMKGRSDFRTEVDMESDRLIHSLLRERFPEDDRVSEESDPLESGSNCKWIVDPLDGTWAYTQGLRFAPSVSIAFAANGRPVAGAIYAPLEGEGELYSAEEGCGATLNGTAIAVDPSDDLHTAIILHERGKKDPWRIAPLIEKLFRGSTMSSLTFGGSASSLARVASGMLRGAVTIGLDVWDVSAAVVILREAGARVTDLKGNEWQLGMDSLVTGNPAIHRKLLTILS